MLVKGYDKMEKPDIKLIIGLGNPGDKHISTRSNVGFKILDIIANNNNIEIKIKKKKSLIGRGDFEGKEVVLLKPYTFAEICGEAALYMASFLRIHPSNIIVILDDISLPLGKLVVEYGDIKNAHPAIDNLCSTLKSNEFIRVRVGILGNKSEDMSYDDYTSEEFDSEEWIKLIEIINDTEVAIRSIVHGEIEEVVEKYGFLA